MQVTSIQYFFFFFNKISWFLWILYNKEILVLFLASSPFINKLKDAIISTSSVINNNKNNTSPLFYIDYIGEINTEKEHSVSREFSGNRSFREKSASQESGNLFVNSDFAAHLPRLDQCLSLWVTVSVLVKFRVYKLVSWFHTIMPTRNTTEHVFCGTLC